MVSLFTKYRVICSIYWNEQSSFSGSIAYTTCLSRDQGFSLYIAALTLLLIRTSQTRNPLPWLSSVVLLYTMATITETSVSIFPDQIRLEASSSPELPDIPLPPPSKNPTQILNVDKGTPDEHVPRDPRLIRLTGVHPFNVEPPLTDLYKEGMLSNLLSCHHKKSNPK